jgi:hypothetical protein
MINKEKSGVEMIHGSRISGIIKLGVLELSMNFEIGEQIIIKVVSHKPI